MPRTTSSIAFHCVIQNPAQKGITKETLQTQLRNINTITFFAFGAHVAPTTGTEHIHCYVRFKNSTTFPRVKNLLPEGTHIERAIGNAAQNIDYIINKGPHEDKDTFIEGSFVQSAPEVPDDALRHMTSNDVIQALESGESPISILRKSPSLVRFNKFSDLQDIEAALLEDQYGTQPRDLEVIYVQGPSRSGKTYAIRDTYGYENVYVALMCTPHPFDSYRGQDVILFDEFRSEVKLAMMLVYLDKYPCALEARYRNRTAAYTKAFVVSNWDFELQYKKERKEDLAAWRARFHRIRVYTAFCTYNEYTVEDYFKMKNGEDVKPLCTVKPEQETMESDNEKESESGHG